MSINCPSLWPVSMNCVTFVTAAADGGGGNWSGVAPATCPPPPPIRWASP